MGIARALVSAMTKWFKFPLCIQKRLLRTWYASASGFTIGWVAIKNSDTPNIKRKDMPKTSKYLSDNTAYHIRLKNLLYRILNVGFPFLYQTHPAAIANNKFNIIMPDSDIFENSDKISTFKTIDANIVRQKYINIFTKFFCSKTEVIKYPVKSVNIKETKNNII